MWKMSRRLPPSDTICWSVISMLSSTHEKKFVPCLRPSTSGSQRRNQSNKLPWNTEMDFSNAIGIGAKEIRKKLRLLYGRQLKTCARLPNDTGGKNGSGGGMQLLMAQSMKAEMLETQKNGGSKEEYRVKRLAKHAICLEKLQVEQDVLRDPSLSSLGLLHISGKRLWAFLSNVPLATGRNTLPPPPTEILSVCWLQCERIVQETIFIDFSTGCPWEKTVCRWPGHLWITSGTSREDDLLEV